MKNRSELFWELFGNNDTWEGISNDMLMHVFYAGWDKALASVEDNIDTQRIDVEGEYSYDKATDLIKHFTDQGFSVDAKVENKTWTIVAERKRYKEKEDE